MTNSQLLYFYLQELRWSQKKESQMMSKLICPQGLVLHLTPKELWKKPTTIQLLKQLLQRTVAYNWKNPSNLWSIYRQMMKHLQTKNGHP